MKKLGIFFAALISPILLFVFVALALPFFVEQTGIPTTYNENIAWGTLVRTNDKIHFVPISEVTDSAIIGTNAYYEKYGTNFVADITDLFPDFNAKKIVLFSNLYNSNIMSVYYKNNTYMELKPISYENGSIVAMKSTDNKVIYMGKMVGLQNIHQQVLDIPCTYINAYFILTFAILSICIILFISSVKDKRLHEMNIYVMGIIILIFAGMTGFVYYSNDSCTHILRANIMEYVTALFCLCEVFCICSISPMLKGKSNL